MLNLLRKKICFLLACSPPACRTGRVSRLLFYFLLLIFLTSCATYTTARGGKKYNNGYVIKRNDVIVPEFTIDIQGRAPEDERLAEQRFKRRKKRILQYYKKMGYFGTMIWEHARHFSSGIIAPFRAPIEGIKYHKYENDPEYRAKIDAQDEEEERIEQERIKAIEEEMREYIEEDLELEESKSKK